MRNMRRGSNRGGCSNPNGLITATAGSPGCRTVPPEVITQNRGESKQLFQLLAVVVGVPSPALCHVGQRWGCAGCRLPPLPVLTMERCRERRRSSC